MKQKQRKPKPNNRPPQKAPVRKKRRRRGRNLLYYIMFTMIAVAVGLILSLTVFFKIETIEAEGLSRYTPEEVIRTTGIQLEENLFRVDDRKVSQALVDTYPYIESVQLRRNLPSKLTLKITEAEPLGTFLQEDGSYVVVSGKGRVLELGRGTPPDGILVVNGVSIEGAQLCQDIPEENNESLGMLRYLVEAINTTGFERITRIDLSDRLNMYIVYEDRVKIELGSENQLEDKLDFAKYALDNNVREDFEGIMDATMAKKISILPAEIHDPDYHDEGVEPEPEEGEEPESGSPEQTEPESEETGSGPAEEEPSKPEENS